MNKITEDMLKLDPEFKTCFKTSIKPFIGILAITGIAKDFDIIKFDDYMSQHKGYNIKTDGSLNQFINKKYGEKAVNLIKDLLK